MKRCSMCGKEKAESEFYLRLPTKDGARKPRTECKACNSIRRKVFFTRLGRRKTQTIQRRQNIMKRHNASLGLFAEMLLVQKGVCAICELPETGIRRGKVQSLAMDHDHVTGRLRGLLCSRCNGALGMVSDSAHILGRMKSYLSGSYFGVQNKISKEA